MLCGCCGRWGLISLLCLVGRFFEACRLFETCQFFETCCLFGTRRFCDSRRLLSSCPLARYLLRFRTLGIQARLHMRKGTRDCAVSTFLIGMRLRDQIMRFVPLLHLHGKSVARAWELVGFNLLFERANSFGDFLGEICISRHSHSVFDRGRVRERGQRRGEREGEAK